MRAVTCLYLYNGDEKFFGEGPRLLLRAIDEYGSLRAAAKSMHLSYSKALHMIANVEKALGFIVTEKVIGGRGGGGSILTKEAKAFLQTYEAYKEACDEANSKLYHTYFSK